MHVLICTLFVIVVFNGIIRLQLEPPGWVFLIPELMSVAVFAYFINYVVTLRRLWIPQRYFLIAGLMSVVLIAGLIIGEATTGPVVGGIRVYFKFLPLFLLPLAYQFSEKQLMVQLKLLLALAILQFPLTFVQRFVLYAGLSGDEARGTFRTGSMAATFLICGLSLVLAFYLKGRLKAVPALLCALLIILTPNMSETKAAFILIPLSLLLPLIWAPTKMSAFRKAIFTVAGGAIFVVMYASVYNVVESNFRPQWKGGNPEYQESIIAFFTDRKVIERYLAPRASSGNQIKEYGRIDKIIAPFQEFHDDPPKLLAGIGFGALTVNPVDAFSTDQYAYIADEGRVGVTLSRWLWEFGILGTTFILGALFFVWRDACALRRESNVYGAIGLGWIGAVPVFVVALCWKNIMENPGIMYPFAYFSGLVVAARFRAAVHSKGYYASKDKQISNPTPGLPTILNSAKAKLPAS